MNRHKLLSTILLLSMLLGGCGGNLIASLRAASASAGPFIETLGAQGVISASHMREAKKDVDMILDGIAQCDAELKAITATGNARKIAKARAYKNLAVWIHQVLAKRNIGGIPQLDRISAIFDGAALALEIYFNSVSGSGPESAAAGDADEALERALKQKVKELEAATK